MNCISISCTVTVLYGHGTWWMVHGGWYMVDGTLCELSCLFPTSHFIQYGLVAMFSF